MKNITIKDKKQLIGISVILLVVLIFFIFIFMPQHRKVSSLKKQMRDIKEKIGLTKSMLGDMEKLGPLLGQMYQEMKHFEDRLPTTKEIASVLSGLSSRLEESSSLEILSIKPQKPSLVLDKDGKPVYMDGKPINRIEIELKLRATYKDLAEYIRKVQDSPDTLASIDSININRNDSIAPRLDIVTLFTIFMIDKD